MAGKQLSYDYVNVKRDLSDAFQEVVQQNPVLRTLIGEGGLQATATKHEWLEDVVSPQTWTVDATRLVGGATLDVVDATGIVVGMVLGFEDVTGTSKTVQLVVTNVVGNTLDVSVYGGTTDERSRPGR